MKVIFWRRNSPAEKNNVSVMHDQWGKVTVNITYGYSVGAALTPAEAREMAAALNELADIAEKDPNQNIED